VVSNWTRSRCQRRLLSICKAGGDADILRFEIIEELRRAIGFAAWGWPLADPDSLLATSGIADRAMWPIVPHLVDYEERAEDVNKDSVLATRGDPVGLLSSATRGDFARSNRWRDILGPYGFADELRAACVDRYGCWGHLRLYRDASDRAFDAADAELLRTVIPTIAAALRHATVQPVETQTLEPLVPGIVILDEHLVVQSWTREAGQWFEAFAGDKPPRGANARCAVFSAASRCLAHDDIEDVPPARARLRLPDGRWVVAEAARLRGRDRGIAVTIHAASSSEVLDLLARAHGLTPRERELAALLVDGLGTRDIAQRLSISHYTVQQHLKAVFDKVGVRSRRELVTGIFASRA
jgi:DNA-binding CsgD family transcriptional regulator